MYCEGAFAGGKWCDEKATYRVMFGDGFVSLCTLHRPRFQESPAVSLDWLEHQEFVAKLKVERPTAS
jgi:hypothetical protein